MKQSVWLTLLFTFSLLHLSTRLLPGQPSRLSVSSVTETLQKGKVLRTSADIYFDEAIGRITSMTHSPEEYVSILNPDGKADIYYPDRNSYLNMQSVALSSRNNNLWFFLNNEGSDLGLQGMGFKVVGTRQEESFTVTTWQAPLKALAEVDKIDLVYENHLPVYLEYRDTRGKITLKVYYEDYLRIDRWMLPGRVTEILFPSPEDSVIRRSTYSDYRYGKNADPRGFDFVIPPDAVRIKQ